MPKISHIIFDWDGTVMDSADKIVKCMRQAALMSDLPIPTAAQVNHVIGISLDQAIATLFDISLSKAQHVSKHYKAAFIENDSLPCQLFAGVHETLSHLRGNYVLGVATGKARRGLHRALAATNSSQYFEKTRCADDIDILSKPHPSMLIQLLSEWKISPENAVMVGDTVYDMQMAETINMPRIGVSYGVHERSKIAEHSPIAIVDEFSQLIPIIENLN